MAAPAVLSVGVCMQHFKMYGHLCVCPPFGDWSCFKSRIHSDMVDIPCNFYMLLSHMQMINGRLDPFFHDYCRRYPDSCLAFAVGRCFRDADADLFPNNKHDLRFVRSLTRPQRRLLKRLVLDFGGRVVDAVRLFQSNVDAPLALMALDGTTYDIYDWAQKDDIVQAAKTLYPCLASASFTLVPMYDDDVDHTFGVDAYYTSPTGPSAMLVWSDDSI